MQASNTLDSQSNPSTVAASKSKELLTQGEASACPDLDLAQSHKGINSVRKKHAKMCTLYTVYYIAIETHSKTPPRSNLAIRLMTRTNSKRPKAAWSHFMAENNMSIMLHYRNKNKS